MRQMCGAAAHIALPARVAYRYYRLVPGSVWLAKDRPGDSSVREWHRP
jgi:hypothetical protein